jgi:hypothetical protein
MLDQVAMTGNFFIAGRLKPSDWYERKRLLIDRGSSDLWAATFDEFFWKRLLKRYLDPIKALQEGPSVGEGFSIVTIQCALIEFLAATRVGKNYRHLKKGQKLKEHEYSESRKLFTSFLSNEEPFKNWFKNENEAKEFYADVRSALMHEARTKNGWRIFATGNIAVDFSKKIIRRNSFQKEIDNYIELYRQLLLKDVEIQKAFIRKFDDLAIN